MSTNLGIDRALNTATKILKNTLPSMGGIFTSTGSSGKGAASGSWGSWGSGSGTGSGSGSWGSGTGTGSGSWGSGSGTGSGSWGSGSGSWGSGSGNTWTSGLGGSTMLSSGPSFSMGSSSPLLKAAFYTVFFLFIVFIALCIIHFTITPIFYFSPGLPGYIYIPGGKDESEIFWTTKQPNQNDFHPRKGNPSDVQKFDINCTISVDVYIPNIVGIPIEKRLLFFKADKQCINATDGTWAKHTVDPSNPNSTREAFRKTLSALNSSQGPRMSFIAYVDEENKLCIDFYNGKTPESPWITMGPFENTPISEPFRITLTIQSSIFEVYLNGKLAQTRYIQGGYLSPVQGNEAIFPSPEAWRASKPGAASASCSSAKTPTSNSIQLLNLHYWSTRILPSSEIFWMSPTIPTKAFFDSIGKDPVAQKPSDTDTEMKTTDYPAGNQQCAKAPSYNPYKDIDLKSGFLLLAGLATAAYIFRP